MTAADCPNTDLLCGFVEGRLPAMDRESLEHHLDRCASCRRALVEVGKAIGDDSQPVSATTDQPVSASRSVPPSSHRLSRYEIRREVAMGGMGVVYEGWDPALGRRVALKLMRPDLKTPAATEQLASEAKALAKVSHPNVLTVFDVGIEGDGVFLAAEYIEGVTMDKGWPHRARSYRDRIDAYMQAARGVAAIHAAGLTHRDIKPANILLGNDGRVRITDFGLAVKDGQQAAPAGTPAYMAPEQAKGDAGAAADQFALAVCLTEALLGERVTAGVKAEDLERRARGAWGTDPPPRTLWSALATALASNPAERHADVDAFIGAIETSIQERAPARSSRRKVAIVSGAVAVAGIGVVTVWAAVGRLPSATASNATDASLTAASDATSSDSALPEHPIASMPLDAEMNLSASGPVVIEEWTAHAGGPRGSGSPSSAPTAEALAAGAPAVTDPNSIVARQTQFRSLVDEASKAMAARDGKKCLEKLAKARELEPSVVDGMTTMRASCEMLAGKCDQGAQRLKSDKNLGAAGASLADQLRASYCPVDNKQSSPAERLKAVGFQAGSPPFSAAKCAQYAAQADKAIKDHGDAKPDPTAVSMARNNVAMCWAWAGDCNKAAAIIGGFFPPGEDHDERLKKHMRQLHPNCANFGG